MAVFTKINKTDISIIENNFKLGKVINYHGIKKGIENTNYYLEFKKEKTVLTIFEKRVNKKDLPFFMKLMHGLSKLKIVCPSPIKNKKGSYLFKIKSKNACLVTFLKGRDKKKLTPSDCRQIGKNIADLLSQFEDPIEVGEIAPDFTAPSINGPDITLSNVLLDNKVTLLDFWAAWCRPCRIENPNLVRLHKKYKDAGFDIIGVSLDRTREQWEQAVIDDNLPWTQVSNLNFWNDPVARRYSIRAIPQSYLLNKDGLVMGKNLRGQELEDRILSLLNAE